MYCKNCGKEIDPNAAMCIHCGYAVNTGKKFCTNCGREVNEGAAFCINCGYSLSNENQGKEAKSKMAAGLFGILLGGFGVHNFYLGYTGKAVAQLLLTIFSCGIASLWGFIEGVMILAGSINQDADGTPLKD